MNEPAFKTIANSLLAGAVIGFLGGAWAVKATEAHQPAAIASANREDLTNSAILSTLSQVHKQCTEVQQRLGPAEASAPAKLSLQKIGG